jgi:hypothetical protein
MATEDKKRCAHPSCSCVVSPERKYCSVQCAAMEDVRDIDCRCAHAACSRKTH